MKITEEELKQGLANVRAEARWKHVAVFLMMVMCWIWPVAHAAPYVLNNNVITDGSFISNIISGSIAFGAGVNGAYIDFGAGANDRASSNGTVITFDAPITSSIVTATSQYVCPGTACVTSTATTNPSVYRSDTNAATLSATVPAHQFTLGNTPAANDLIFGVDGTAINAFKVDYEGDTAVLGSMTATAHLVGTKKAPVVQEASLAQKGMAFGSDTFTAGTRVVTFSTAFSIAPESCTCSDASGVALPCSVGTVTATTAEFFGTAANAFYWFCIGTS